MAQCLLYYGHWHGIMTERHVQSTEVSIRYCCLCDCIRMHFPSYCLHSCSWLLRFLHLGSNGNSYCVSACGRNHQPLSSCIIPVELYLPVYQNSDLAFIARLPHLSAPWIMANDSHLSGDTRACEALSLAPGLEHTDHGLELFCASCQNLGMQAR